MRRTQTILNIFKIIGSFVKKLKTPDQSVTLTLVPATSGIGSESSLSVIPAPVLRSTPKDETAKDECLESFLKRDCGPAYRQGRQALNRMVRGKPQ